MFFSECDVGRLNGAIAAVIRRDSHEYCISIDNSALGGIRFDSRTCVSHNIVAGTRVLLHGLTIYHLSIKFNKQENWKQLSLIVII